MPIQRVQTHPRPTHLLQHLGSYLLERSRNSGDGASAEGNHENLQELEGTKVYGLQESQQHAMWPSATAAKATFHSAPTQLGSNEEVVDASF